MSPEAESGRARARRSKIASIKLLLTIIALVAFTSGFWYSQLSSPRASAPKPDKPRSTSAEHLDVLLPPMERPHEPVPVTEDPEPVSRTDLPEASDPPLEDVIERAMPAIVMIQTPKSRGSGFFVRPDLVATNAHVVAGFMFVAVTTRDGTRLTGKIGQLSDQYDIALVQVPRLGPTDAQLPLGDSSGLRLGQGIVSLGWALSLTQSTVTRGIVTGVRHEEDRNLLQMDAVPNPGDSGGPVLDKRGNVVGITTSRAESGKSGYAVAIDDVKPFVDKIVQNVFTVPLSPRVVEAVPQGRPSDAESRRNVGLQRYTDALRALEGNVVQLDTMWSRYKAACQITLIPPGQTHEWFNLYNPKSPVQQTPPWCSDILADLKRRAQAISQAMMAAAETARQADVYPGTLRAIRARYRLDYSGWDN